MNKVENQILQTYEAAISLRNQKDSQLKKLLKAIATGIEVNTSSILSANRKDIARQYPDNPKTDRLLLNEERIRQIIVSIRNISGLPNPSGRVLESSTLPNGLGLEKWAVPLGVVGVIYESRPNVTFDIAALCLRSQNACVLKGSSDAEYTNKAAVALIRKIMKEQGMNPNCVTLLPSGRETVQELFKATKYIDVLIPRGSDSLIQYVRKNSLVPVIETGAGVCHVYVEKRADMAKALSIVVNAKVSRPSVCNAMDTLLVDEAIATDFLKRLQPLFAKHKVTILAEQKAYNLLKGYPYLQKATAADFGKEFLSLKCAIKVVKNIDMALTHIRTHSTKHSEAIISENKKQADRFLRQVDAAAVYVNASTRFTDGEAFGLGAEIGISTQKLHARGPFALEKLVTEKWVIQGNGQIRN